MPANARSLLVTDGYRRRRAVLRDQAVTVATNNWRRIDPRNLDRSHAAWVTRTAPLLADLQRIGARLSAAYLTAYLSSEMGRRTSAARVDLAARVGRARDGRAIDETLVPTLYTVKGAIGEGLEMAAALSQGLSRAVGVVGEEAVAPARGALSDGMVADDRIVGWRRVTSGGCGACLALADGAIHADDDFIEVHDNCSCDSEPVVADVDDSAARPTGHEMFTALGKDDQDALLGEEKAQLIRTGEVALHDLVQREPMAVIPDGITERPLQDLH